ncbi:diguanylate cyclase [Acidaminobacter sp. JC074]|uniref:sensor domain-containing diguanylate cyclase n=1 Tax=Acidaminobacter sp. JC074 TaxID=2530199 RepID=UPI001F10EB1E|nr:diguanylate cyclase [Acidaminobacter sp. JC074]MCH4888481.1 diguanylate cyclase [Acidaminobacter sp. JC074]
MKIQTKFKDVLRDFIYRYTILSAILILGFAVMLYGVLYYGVFQETFDLFETEVKENINDEIKNEIRQMSFHFDDLASQTRLLGQAYSDVFNQYDKYDYVHFKALFDIHENGVFYKTENDGGSSLYYSAITPLTDYAVEKALKTEWTGPVMKHIVDENELIVQSYFNTFDNMNRIYPFLEDVATVFGPFQDIQTYQFYYLADKDHNPNRETVWTLPYLDPAGQGWIISCLYPIYRDDFLEGVVGIDVTLKKLVEHSMSGNALGDVAVLLVDSSGEIIAMNEKAEIVVGLKEAHEENYGIVTSNIVKPSEFNVYSMAPSAIKENMIAVIESKPVSDNFNYVIHKGTIEQTNWQLIGLSEKDYVDKKLTTIYDEVLKNLLIIIICMILLFAFLLNLYRHRIKVVSDRVSIPLEYIIRQTKDYAVKGEYSSLSESGIKEIDDLNKGIYMMTKEIKEREVRLLEAQIEHQKAEKTIEAYYKDAITDELTQLYNRRKIDDVIDSEVKRSRRYNKSFSVILLDIDYFKEINDEYGHQTGDEVLKSVAGILKANVRESDVVSRWGGDEFLIVTIETDIVVASSIAEKIRLELEGTVLYHNIVVTTSVGVADFDNRHDDARDIIRKADLALYEAKNRGKNNVVSIEKNGEHHEYK